MVRNGSRQPLSLCRRDLPESDRSRPMPIFEGAALRAIQVIPALKRFYPTEDRKSVDEEPAALGTDQLRGRRVKDRCDRGSPKVSFSSPASTRMVETDSQKERGARRECGGWPPLCRTDSSIQPSYQTVSNCTLLSASKSPAHANPIAPAFGQPSEPLRRHTSQDSAHTREHVRDLRSGGTISQGKQKRRSSLKPERRGETAKLKNCV